jgi:predicted acyltransferase
VTAKYLLIAGCLCLAAGLLWSHWFPLNKRLWTSSFVLWTGGISLLSLWVLFELVDVRQVSRRWFYPAIVFGTNALAAYVFSEFLASALQVIHSPSGRSLQRWLFLPFALAIPNPCMAAVGYAVAFVAVCFVLPWVLYRKQIFLKV